jgi:hypothetical protein
VCKQARLKKIDHSKKLAGIIEEELVVDKTQYTNIIQPYFDTYSDAHKTWYGTNVTKIETADVWVNYMKKGEYNPPHTHTKCALSSVLYLEMPPGLQKER